MKRFFCDTEDVLIRRLAGDVLIIVKSFLWSKTPVARSVEFSAFFEIFSSFKKNTAGLPLTVTPLLSYSFLKLAY